MHLNQLETFMWIATLRNFHAAAARLNLTQPGISARIAALELELGRRLFTRRKRKVALTKDGVDFLHYAQEVLRLTTSLRSTRSTPELRHQTLRIGMVDTLSHAILPALVRETMMRISSANVEITVDSTAHLQRMLANREIDIAFLVGVIYEPNIRAIWLADLQLEWLASPEIVAARPTTYNLKDLIKHRIITFEAGTHVSHEIDALIGRKKLTPTKRIGCTSVGMIREFVRQGLGIGTLPAAAAQAEIARNEIVILPTNVKLPAFDIFACYATDSPSDAGATIAEIGQRLCRPFSSAKKRKRAA